MKTMSVSVYVEHRLFHLVNDSDEIRKSHVYDEIKGEINKQNSPFSGGTDWELVKNKCTLIADKSGIDLLLCCYYTVAITKLQGVTGLANGLELLAASLLVSLTDNKNSNKRKELIEWVNNSIIKEIKLLKPSYEKLRDLYRCERYCEQIDRTFTEKQPEYVANMDGVAYVIFEHIDRLEIQYRSQEKLAATVPSTIHKPKLKWHYYVLVILITALTTYQLSLLLSKQSPIHYIQSNFLPNKPLEREQREELNQYIDTMATDSLNWLGETPAQQDETINKLAFLLGDEERIDLLRKQWLLEKKESIEAVDSMVNKFDLLRTQLSNINVRIQKSHLNSLKNDMNAVEKVSKSLSPIYARVGYIEQLIKVGDDEKANKELNILQQRLEGLSWKVSQLQTLILD